MATPDPSVRLTQPVYRAHNPEWAWSPESGEGARRHGGRFNPKGVPALYTSLHELTAIREVSPLGRPMQPLTLCQYDVDCDGLFNSRDTQACVQQDVSQDMLACPFWRRDMFRGDVPDSHRLALSLIERGYRGMIVRSFAADAEPSDTNVVFWTWSNTPPDQVSVVDDFKRLPANRDSWQSQ